MEEKRQLLSIVSYFIRKVSCCAARWHLTYRLCTNEVAVCRNKINTVCVGEEGALHVPVFGLLPWEQWTSPPAAKSTLTLTVKNPQM